jgi:7,8-dihydroneopterin 2',3'-cyclic phosphate phosphodiesterase
MKKLIELADKIKDVELRKKVVEFLKNPTLSHKEFKKYPRMKLEDGKTLSSSSNGAIERDILNHTIALTELCIKTAEIVKKNYEISLDEDALIAASILHDITHLFEYKKVGGEITHTGILLDHSMLGVAELYHRGLPEKVLHIIAAHFGENGPTPPRNFEALIFHHLDNTLAVVESHLSEAKAKTPMQLLLFDEDMLKKIAEKAIEDEKKSK